MDIDGRVGIRELTGFFQFTSITMIPLHHPLDDLDVGDEKTRARSVRF
jgi:hypothetical protein